MNVWRELVLVASSSTGLEFGFQAREECSGQVLLYSSPVLLRFDGDFGKIFARVHGQQGLFRGV